MLEEYLLKQNVTQLKIRIIYYLQYHYTQKRLVSNLRISCQVLQQLDPLKFQAIQNESKIEKSW